MTLHNFSEQLDASFGDGPEHRPVATHLQAGRRAARRRTVATAVAAVSAAAVIATGALVVTGGGETRAVDPAQTPTDAPSSPAASTEEQDPVGYDDEGRLVYAEGVEVVQHIDNPLHRTPPRASDGVELRVDGETSYWLLERRRDGYMASSDPAGKNVASLEDWLAFQSEAQGVAPTDGLVTLTADGDVVAGQGATILRQRTGVDVGESFAPADAPTAAVLVERDGTRWWVLARRLDGGPPEYFPVDLAVGGRDLDAFLDHSRAQYAGGEGLR